MFIFINVMELYYEDIYNNVNKIIILHEILRAQKFWKDTKHIYEQVLLLSFLMTLMMNFDRNSFYFTIVCQDMFFLEIYMENKDLINETGKIMKWKISSAEIHKSNVGFNYHISHNTQSTNIHTSTILRYI